VSACGFAFVFLRCSGRFRGEWGVSATHLTLLKTPTYWIKRFIGPSGPAGPGGPSGPSVSRFYLLDLRDVEDLLGLLCPDSLPSGRGGPIGPDSLVGRTSEMGSNGIDF